MNDNRYADRGSELFDDYREPIGLFRDAFDADGEPTRFTRERGNGRHVEERPADTGFGVDRNKSGQFASKDREPVPQIRDDDGTLGLDPFAVAPSVSGSDELFGEVRDD